METKVSSAIIRVIKTSGRPAFIEKSSITLVEKNEWNKEEYNTVIWVNGVEVHIKDDIEDFVKRIGWTL